MIRPNAKQNAVGCGFNILNLAISAALCFILSRVYGWEWLRAGVLSAVVFVIVFLTLAQIYKHTAFKWRG